MADVAYFFRFQPSEVHAMTVDDLIYWAEQGARIAGGQRRQ